MYADIVFQEMSNRESWNEYFSLNDVDTGEPIRLLDKFGVPYVSFTATVRYFGQTMGCGWGTNPYPDQIYYDQYPNRGAELLATLGNGLTIIDNGVVYMEFTLDQMRALCRGFWRFSLTLASADGRTGFEVVRGMLPIISY